MFRVPDQINTQEFLDDPKIPLDERKRLLAELDRINDKTGTYKTVIKEFFAWHSANFPSSQKIKILEIGSGSGGLAREILKASQNKMQIEYHIMDVDPDILDWARDRSGDLKHQIHIHMGGQTYLKQFQSQSFDVVISLQMIHHLHPHTLVQDFFQDVMNISRNGFWMVDFERKALNPLIHAVGNWLVKTDPILKEDGWRSLIRSYTQNELLNAVPQIQSWKIQTRQYWWNPFIIIHGVRK